MGLFKDVHQVSKMGQQIDQDWSRDATRKASTEAIAGLSDLLQQETSGLSAMTDGIDCSAQILGLGPTSGTINSNPMIPLDLLIIQPGLPPRPLSTTVIVPMAHFSSLSEGATLPVRVSASDADAVAVIWSALSS
jgi:hypothetical protein